MFLIHNLLLEAIVTKIMYVIIVINILNGGQIGRPGNNAS